MLGQRRRDAHELVLLAQPQELAAPQGLECVTNRRIHGRSRDEIRLRADPTEMSKKEKPLEAMHDLLSAWCALDLQTGPSLSDRDLQEFERRFHLHLPLEFRRYLLTVNGMASGCCAKCAKSDGLRSRRSEGAPAL